MGVTFIIGNGFDLHMGMKTKYVDMYDGYIESKSKSECIRNFKAILRRDKPKDYTTWADFEIQMGQTISEFDDERDFIECVRDFKEYLAKHLRHEQSLFTNELLNVEDKLISSEMKNSLRKFHYSLIQKDKDYVDFGIIQSSDYNFITFNYTNILEQLLEKIYFEQFEPTLKINTPLHIHGTLDNGIVLGIDNEDQLSSDVKFDKSIRLTRSFIKPFFNTIIDPDFVHKVKETIQNSSVICIYGLSLGQSDLTWIQLIIEWLKSSPSHHLVYFKHSDKEVNLWHKDLVMDIEDDEKDWLLKRIKYVIDEENIDIRNQIHIPIAYDIFNILPIIKKKGEGDEEVVA